jgi:DNA replication protein DnaC
MLPCAPAGEQRTRSYDERRAECDRLRRNEQIHRAFMFSGLPERHKVQSKAGLQRYDPWFEACVKVQDVLLDGGMVALIGTPGSGKTQIAVEAAKAVLVAMPSIRPIKYEVLADMFGTVRECYGPAASRTEMGVIRDYTSPHLLILDEIDKRSGTDNEFRLLHRILDKRYRSLLPTLLIGNVPDADGLKELLDGQGDGLGPLFGRLQQTGGVVQAFGWNFRAKGGVA